MSEQCQSCGASVASGAFLGLCPACSQGGESGGVTTATVSAGRPAWVKWALIVGGVLGVLFVLMMFTATCAPIAEPAVQETSAPMPKPNR